MNRLFFNSWAISNFRYIPKDAHLWQIFRDGMCCQRIHYRFSSFIIYVFWWEKSDQHDVIVWKSRPNKSATISRRKCAKRLNRVLRNHLKHTAFHLLEDRGSKCPFGTWQGSFQKEHITLPLDGEKEHPHSSTVITLTVTAIYITWTLGQPIFTSSPAPSSHCLLSHMASLWSSRNLARFVHRCSPCHILISVKASLQWDFF